MPGVPISAVHAAPPLHKQVLSSLVTVAQIAVIGGALGGEAIVPSLRGTAAGGLVAPLEALQQNKMAACGAAWFIGSAFSASLLKTGAFEVEVHGPEGDSAEAKTVWSGIARGGRPPMSQSEMHDIMHALAAHFSNRHERDYSSVEAL